MLLWIEMTLLLGLVIERLVIAPYLGWANIEFDML